MQHDIEQLELALERRTLDRRRLSGATLIRGMVRGRRRSVRRSSEVSVPYVDWHSPHLLLISLSILVLSALDAAITLNLLQHGAVEANPFMDWLLQIDIQLFVAIKLALTGIGVVFLVTLADFQLLRLFRMRSVLYCCLLMYVTLMVYEFYLLRNYL
jgi:hypothetical protein